jgi:glycine oxidase
LSAPPDTADVVVVGAGAVGAAVAYELSRRGARVVVLEKDAIGSGSSAHATGLLSILGTEFTPGDSFAMGCEAYSVFTDLVPQLQELTGMDVLYQRPPALRLALDAEEERMIRESLEWQSKLVPAEWISGAAARRIEPRLTEAVRGAAYEPESAQLDSYRLNLALARGAELHGAQILSRTVTSLVRSGARVTGVVCGSEIISCGTVVLAPGPWADACADWLQFPVPVSPMKGERLLLSYAGAPLPCIISSPARGHMITRLDGLWSVGSTGGRDYDDRDAFSGVEFDRQPTEKAKFELIQRALDVLPDLAGADVVEQLAGSRPLSVDRKPIIGAVPGLDGVLLATGHSTKGIHLAPITARIIATHIFGDKPAFTFNPDTFAPARFAEMKSPDFHDAGQGVDE